MKHLSGQIVIGEKCVRGTEGSFHATDPKTNEKLDPVYYGASKEEVGLACRMAEAAFKTYKDTHLKDRAKFLRTIATEIDAVGDQLTERGCAETGLPEKRLIGERGRTCAQLRLFAELVEAGEWLGVRIDPAMPEREPMPRPDVRQHHVPLGPVAVFGASNFPLAFSVAGGDTASALAAGCPVVVKGHPAHPGTSEIVGRAIQRAANACGMPEGVFSLLFGPGNEVGQALVEDPRIKAVGFTGSRKGGLAIQSLAQSRPEPIPVYAEMSSTNPVFLMPDALKHRADQIAKGFIESLNLGAGQFCTNPGLIFAVEGSELDTFIEEAVSLLEGEAAQTMLTPEIHDHYEAGNANLSRNDNVRNLGSGKAGEGLNQCQARLYATSSVEFSNNPELRKEVFGATSLIVMCRDEAEMLKMADQLEGQLTATIHIDEQDHALARRLLPILERKAGRILANGWPTGVEVCHAMVHGGPFPATTDSRSTSVGTAAIYRFLRPVCYQSMPQELLPAAVRDDNPFHVSRLVDGERQR